MFQALRHDHLLVDQVGPRQVGAGLDATNTRRRVRPGVKPASCTRSGMEDQDVVRYLDVDHQLQEISGRHDDGGVERDDVALVQLQVQVGRQPLRHDT